jgi:hypothetical protein
MDRIPPNPVPPEEMRYLDIGLANICDCPTCTDKRRLADTIELLAKELVRCYAGNTDPHYEMDEIAQKWYEWAIKWIDENKNK